MVMKLLLLGVVEHEPEPEPEPWISAALDWLVVSSYLTSFVVAMMFCCSGPSWYFEEEYHSEVWSGTVLPALQPATVL